MIQYDFSICKLCNHGDNIIHYKLEKANVYVCSNCGFHYTDHLDEEYRPTSVHSTLTDKLDQATVDYIDEKLQSNVQRFEHHKQIVLQYVQEPGATLLDVGFGGAVFLSRMKELQFDGYGIELDQQYLLYARERLQMGHVFDKPIQDAFWEKNYASFFKVIVLWDVLEHVNFPHRVIAAAQKLLQPGGYIFIDTPCRDGFYHKSGKFISSITGGHMHGLLHLMYSNHSFGHKQIFSKKDINRLLKEHELELVSLQQFHEISFPYDFYLKKIFHNKLLLKLSVLLSTLFFRLFKIRNKMIVVGRKL